MKLLLKEQLERLHENWRENEAHRDPDTGTGETVDQKVVVKLFNAFGAGTWLLTEKDPDGSRCFGLCDLGMGLPEIGYVCLDELKAVRLGGGLDIPCIERDRHFTPRGTLSEYADAASRERQIVQLPAPWFDSTSWRRPTCG